MKRVNVSIKNILCITFIVCIIFFTTHDTLALVCGTDTVSYGGKNYLTVQIGNQCWFRENLNVGTMLASASTLPSDPAPTINDPNTVQKWCYSNSSTNCNSDGGLYTWAEANALSSTCNTSACSVSTPSQGICPTGWHIPSDGEFMVLEEYLGMCSGTSTGCSGALGNRGTDQGSKMSLYVLNGNNSSGFSILLTGFRTTLSTFGSRTVFTYQFTSTQLNATYATNRSFRNTEATVGRTNTEKINGYPVRCVRNNSAPTVITNTVSSITTNAAVGNGNVTDYGSGSNPTRYIDWGTVSGSYTNNCSAGSGGLGAYSCSMTGLQPNTTYYVRARVVNSTGTAYGTQTSFTTAVATPAVSTHPITGIAANSAIGNGEVTVIGAENPERMIEWGTVSGNYTNFCSASTGGIGMYSCTMSLLPDTTYYVRAKVANSAGTSYGSETSFTTQSPIFQPRAFKLRGTAIFKGGVNVK